MGRHAPRDIYRRPCILVFQVLLCRPLDLPRIAAVGNHHGHASADPDWHAERPSGGSGLVLPGNLKLRAVGIETRPSQ